MRQSAGVETLSWDSVEAYIQNGALSVVALGASCKEHGYHLPMNTDWLQAEWLAAQAMDMDYVLVWPTIGLGHYPAFVDFPGVTLKEETYRMLLRDYISNILGSGAQRLLVINTGVSTTPGLDAVAQDKDFQDKLHLLHSVSARHHKQAVARLSEQPFGGTHADEMETSLMLATHPEVVDMDSAEASPNHEPFKPGPLNRRDSDRDNYTPSGVYGDPRLATAEKGKKLAEARRKDLQEALYHCRYS